MAPSAPVPRGLPGFRTPVITNPLCRFPTEEPLGIFAHPCRRVSMRRQALLAVVLLAGVAAPAFGQDVELKWKFKEGDKFYVEDVTVMKQSVAVVGQVIKEEQKTTTVTSYQIEKAGTAGIVVKMKIEGVDVRSDSPIGLYAKIMEKT